jgi:hypothetical protein
MNRAPQVIEDGQHHNHGGNGNHRVTEQQVNQWARRMVGRFLCGSSE